jgi:fused signal recognition particle receptor
MLIEPLAIAVAAGLVVAIAAIAIELWMPAFRSSSALYLDWLEFRRSNQPDRSRAVATDSAFEAEKKRLADLNAELAAAETSLAERERQMSVKLDELAAAQRQRSEAAGDLARQEAALAERERILQQSQADAEKSAAEERARIEAREAALATKEAELEQQRSELADQPQRPAAERELIWWEKQLGRPRSAKK